MNIDDSEIIKKFPWLKKVLAFRNQALCIKTNIQILKDVWKLQPYFKERSTGAFYGCIQDNCIFRIILETYKMLYDTKSNSQNIYGMANEVYTEMVKLDEFINVRQKLLDMKKELKASLNKYSDVKNIIIDSRNRVYAHNDQEYHWFTAAYIDNWGMTDQTYDDIFEISNVCLDYCNEILNLFDIRPVYEYSNHDDVKHLFGMKTVRDEEMELLEEVLG
ncbi:MAG: hypothetical protein K2O59_01795 [Lachnospiraceae bacterium]|nr:hypothetical protein [Lachnospiraceae bacterium]